MSERTEARGARAGVVTIVTMLYALAYLVWERAGWGSPALRSLAGDLAFMPLNLTVAVMMLRAARGSALDPRVQRGLRLFGTGCLMVFVGNGISLGYSLVLGSSPAVSWADPFYLADNVLMLAALLSFPITRRTHLERVKFLLDAATVLIGGAIAIWYFTVLPTTEAGQGALSTLILAFAYPLASLLVLYGATTVVLRGPVDPNRLAFRLLLASVVVSVVADLAFDLVLLDQGVRTAVWTDAVYLLFYVLAIASAEQYLRHPVPRAHGNPELRPRIQRLSPLPYMAIAMTYGLLLAAAISPWTDPVSGIVVGAILMTLLVVIRQLLTVQQNIQLLAESAAESRFRSLVQHSSDVILVAQSNGLIRFASPSVARVLRRDPAALIGRPLAELLDPEDRERAVEFLRQAATTATVGSPVEWRFRLPDGSVLHTEMLATNLLGDPTVRGVVLNGRDVSERKRLERELTFQAFHDPLTGLANRALFLDRVSHALTIARRQGRAVSLLYLDLDDFKQINDSMGHTEGDRLLTTTAERLRGSGRAGDTVARLGGDEFAVLVEGGAAAEGLQTLVERCQAAMARPFHLGGNEVAISVSIGIATAAPEDSADDLLRNADMAMYNAKRQGKGRTETYQAYMYADVKHRLEVEAALRAAIEHEGLSLVYQPIFSLRTGRLEGVEALVRWTHPRFGAMLPQHFIPIAEETGLIVRLGEWVLHEACRQAKRWRTAHPGTPLTMAVNISGRQLQEMDILGQVREALAESGVDPSAMVLEITESVLMQREGQFLPQLAELRALGVKLAIDDFGTGYSSLGYLQRCPIDMIKIARPFVEDIGSGAEKSALARAIIGLGETLRLRTVAEGVERTEQCVALMSLGCDLGQGYYFAPPLTAGEVHDLLDHPRAVLPSVPAATIGG
jgi:diguanylate cyclase (GGDEF)-like protein/PAS domain S-box-containing protein